MHQLYYCQAETLYQQLEYTNTTTNNIQIDSNALYQQLNNSIYQVDQTNYYQQISLQPIYSLINDVLSYKYTHKYDEVVLTRVIGEGVVINSNETHTKLPLFFNHNYTIKIPKKV